VSAVRPLRLIFVLAALGLAAAPLAQADPPTAYVIGGTAVPTGGAPYAVYIQASTGGGTYVSCTGSVIAPTIILTAAHCVFNKATGAVLAASAISVSAGSVNRPPSSPPPPANVAVVRPDPYFNPATFQADAALLFLTAAVPASATPVALATTANGELYAPGTQATFSGWGETVADVSSSAPMQLQSGTVAILANSACQTAVEFHPGYTLCTGGPTYRPATCHGDSGGPLVVTTASGPVQIGVTSYGSAVGCGIAPDYFTRVSSVQTWIASAIAGAAPPPSFVPPFNGPAAPAAALVGDGISATFGAPAPDPATQQASFTATLLNAAGAVITTQTLAPTATTVVFPNVQPGTYTVSLVVAYSEGSSAAAVSSPVTLAAPKAKTKPKIVGPNVVGYRVSCKNATWVWPGGASFTVAWLRTGKLRPGQTGQSYKIGTADAGKKISCRVTLHATTGSVATATSASSTAAVRLTLLKAPKIVGSPVVGSTLQCATGTWKHTGTLALSLVWRRDSTIIKGANKPKHIVVQADAGHQITCKVSVKAGPQSAWYRTASVLAH
jgi:secreted trypsin-like serine protease